MHIPAIFTMYILDKNGRKLPTEYTGNEKSSIDPKNNKDETPLFCAVKEHCKLQQELENTLDESDYDDVNDSELSAIKSAKKLLLEKIAGIHYVFFSDCF